MQEQPNEMFCECGCGESIEAGKRFRHGHNRRGEEFTQEHRRKIGDALRKPKIPIPCGCGCGELANPGRKFVFGHGMRGRTLDAQWRQKIADSRRGEQNYAWIGDEVGYHSVHMRLRRVRGRATTHLCEVCGLKANSWALNHGYPALRREDGKPYAVDLEAYHSLCWSCHAKADRAGGFRI